MVKLANGVLAPFRLLSEEQIRKLEVFDGYSTASTVLGRLLASGGPGGPLADLPLDVEKVRRSPEEARRLIDEADAARERAASASVSSGARYGEAVRRATDLTDGWLRIAINVGRHVLDRGSDVPYVVSRGNSAPPARLYGMAWRNAKEMLPVLSDELRHQLRSALLPAFMERRRARRLVLDRLRAAEHRLHASDKRWEVFSARALQQIDAIGKDLEATLAQQVAMQEREVRRAQVDLDRARNEYKRIQADSTMAPEAKESLLNDLRDEVQFEEELLAMERDFLSALQDTTT